MTIIWITLAVTAFIVWAITIFDIVRRHLGAKRTAAWLLLVLILPFVGAIGYWATRQPEPAKRSTSQRWSGRRATRRRAGSSGIGHHERRSAAWDGKRISRSDWRSAAHERASP